MSEMYFTENGWRAEEPDNNGLMCVFHETGADQMFLTEEDLTAFERKMGELLTEEQVAWIPEDAEVFLLPRPQGG